MGPEGKKKHQEEMKRLRISDTGKEKQHEIDNFSKKKNRETPEGKKKHQEESKESMKKLRISDTGKKKQHEIDNFSKKKIRETPEGKEKQKKKVRENILFDKEAAFQEVKEMSKVDPSILDTN